MVLIEVVCLVVFGVVYVWDVEIGVMLGVVLCVDIVVVKVVVNDVYVFCVQEVIQLYGGVGFMWEYDLYFYFKCVQVLSVQFGSMLYLFEWIVFCVIDGGVLLCDEVWVVLLVLIVMCVLVVCVGVF